jgi:hypothetical protein
MIEMALVIALMAMSVCAIGVLRFSGGDGDSQTLPARLGGVICQAAGYAGGGDSPVWMKMQFSTKYLCCGYAHPRSEEFYGCE